MSDIVEIDTGYKPRPLQYEIHQHLARFSVLAIHRRFGKTVMSINHGLSVGLACPLPNPHISFISPLYKQSKTVAWDYVKDATRLIPGVKQYESELRVDIPMGEVDGKPSVMRYQLFGADNPDALRGMYHDYIIFDEFGNQPPTIWTEVCSPALADREGGALFLGTPNGKNHFYKIHQKASSQMANGDPEWFAATYRADETGVIPDKELAAQRDNMPEEDYDQEFLCDWAAAVRGSYYASNMKRLRSEGRLVRIPYESGLPVFCAFDLGTDDYTACWFYQCFRNEIRCIKYMQWRNMGLLDVLKEMTHLPYIYGTMFLPWDAGHRERSSGRSTSDMVEELGYEVEIVPRDTIQNGINCVRETFTQLFIDPEQCQEGIDCLENYRKKINPKTNEFMDAPSHDEFSHGADAMRYLCQSYDPYMGQQFIANSTKFNAKTRQVIRSV